MIPKDHFLVRKCSLKYQWPVSRYISGSNFEMIETYYVLLIIDEAELRLIFEECDIVSKITNNRYDYYLVLRRSSNLLT